jgi:hypothetical protein
MNEEAFIYPALKVPEMLTKAEKEARNAQKSQKPDVKWQMYGSALRRVEEAWKTLKTASEQIGQNYSIAETEHTIESKPEARYNVSLYELDKDSHPSTVGMALPKMYEQVAGTREEVMQKFREFTASEEVDDFLEPRSHLR